MYPKGEERYFVRFEPFHSRPSSGKSFERLKNNTWYVAVRSGIAFSFSATHFFFALLAGLRCYHTSTSQAYTHELPC